MDGPEEMNLLKQAVETWGTEAQLWMLAEECSELIVAVCKMHRASSDQHEAVRAFVDELVDVSVMVDQWILEVGQERFDRARDLKMRRLATKLDTYRKARAQSGAEPPAHIDLTAYM
jgi:hypothetical protein